MIQTFHDFPGDLVQFFARARIRVGEIHRVRCFGELAARIVGASDDAVGLIFAIRSFGGMVATKGSMFCGASSQSRIGSATASYCDKRLEAEQKLHRLEHAVGVVEVVIDAGPLDPGADDKAGRSMRIDMIDAALGVVLDDEDRGVLQIGLLLTASTICARP